MDFDLREGIEAHRRTSLTLLDRRARSVGDLRASSSGRIQSEQPAVDI
jgi:hypothetical protein